MRCEAKRAGALRSQRSASTASCEYSSALSLSSLSLFVPLTHTHVIVAPPCLNHFLRGVAATVRQATSTRCRSANTHTHDTKTDTSGLLPMWLAGLRHKRVRWEGVHCWMNIVTNLSSTGRMKEGLLDKVVRLPIFIGHSPSDTGVVCVG